MTDDELIAALADSITETMYGPGAEERARAFLTEDQALRLMALYRQQNARYAAALMPIIRAQREQAAREAWTDCVAEASACGWLHRPAALDMLGRNPHETKGNTE